MKEARYFRVKLENGEIVILKSSSTREKCVLGLNCFIYRRGIEDKTFLMGWTVYWIKLIAITLIETF